MNRNEKREAIFRREVEQLKQSGRTCPAMYPHNVFTKLYAMGYTCKDDEIQWNDQAYPIKFFMKQQTVGKWKKQHILSVFIFGYMPQETDIEILTVFMRGLDRMISGYTEFSTGKIKAGMSFCIEQESMTDFMAEYCIRENCVNAFLGNIPLIHESSTGLVYVKFDESRMPLHYSMHQDDLRAAFSI